ncbi:MULTISPECIES: hypothetical protein [unclassified Novosphingobium]|uniref:hypothetical protein n=1 Tax=unclassified Novosphingobium TaxID=2644732 RepID=UPI0008691EE2|nr:MULTISPECIES: hypothetical protein [unclassified Novosphingobium]MBN9143754.1 hypothetical protein [Novosphingobium sp.]ODU84364.1 MAG: hypothetical protein ABT10_02985 [Novosphingobium sp. SCN 63-17]OJX92904.1 MAG: hypothetical protein BGP00_23585 [Novosphingobium sp. 63-713]
MRVICAPDRLVLHPQTRRRIDGVRGIPHDQGDFAIAQLIEHGDLLLIEDEVAEEEAEVEAAPVTEEKE